MAVNRLHITELGLQAANNASAGGVFINLTNWQVGNGTAPTDDNDDKLSGQIISQGQISFIEVLDEHASRFVLDIPDYAVTEKTTITECAVFVDSGVMFGRCLFDNPLELLPGEGMRLNCVLSTNRCNLTVINVTIGDYSSVPVTPFVWSLPSPVASEHNLVGVLNGLVNSDGSSTPITAIRYGSGNFEWSFSGYTRVYRGTVTPTAVGFDAPLVGFQDNEVLIAHVAAGAGLANSRRLRYDAIESEFVELDGKPLGITSASVVSIWKRLDGNNILVSPCSYPPQTKDIPEDYVLTRGLGNCPVWAPPKQTANIISTLYVSPGKLKINRVAFTGNDREYRYILPNGVFTDVNHVYTAVGAVTQHRSAFDVQGSELEFSENIPSGALIDLRAFSKVAGNGSYVDVVAHNEKGDGNRTRFPLSIRPETVDDTFVFVRGGLQSYSAYSYDEITNEIVTNEPVDPGLDVEILVLKHTARDGYSTRILTHTFITYGDTLFFDLPVYPQTKEQVWISVSGTHIHTDLYNIVDNKVVLQGAIPGGLEVECFIFENVKAEGTRNTNLRGMVTDATLTHKSLRLHRHDAPDVMLRIPTVSLESGPGIRVSGRHPNYTIESLISEQLTPDTVFKLNYLEKKNGSEEIITTRRVQITSDMLLQVTCDFSAQLGPGFLSSEGEEIIEYVIGFRTTQATEPEYGRQIRGTGKNGFSLIKEGVSQYAYSCASLTQSYTLNKANIPAGYIDVVCKMRVRNSNISRYESLLFLNVNIMGFPKI